MNDYDEYLCDDFIYICLIMGVRGVSSVIHYSSRSKVLESVCRNMKNCVL